MAKTRHIQARMSQRAIRQSLLELACSHGSELSDGKVILNRQALNNFISECNSMNRTAQHGLKRGGLVVVEGENGDLITTYALDSYRPGRRRKRVSNGPF